MRKLILPLILLLALYFLYSRLAEVEQVAATLQRGDWKWLSLALVVHIAWIVNMGASYRAVYRLLGIEEKTERLSALAAAAYFVNVVAPTAGMSVMAVFIADGRRRGHPVGRVTVATALFVLYEYLGFLVVLGLGLIVLFRRGQLFTGEIIATILLLIIASALGLLVYLGARSADALGRVLARSAQFINLLAFPFIRREYLHVSRAYEFAQEIAEGLREARRSQEGLILPAALALSSKALLITVLFLVFMAFQQPFSTGTIIAGFSIGYLFLIVSPTPSGLGFAEGAMTLALTSLRVPLAPAGIITLAYRGITFWLTLAYGALAFRWVGRTGGEKIAEDPSPTAPQETR
jgi:uncharacterized protein (TIRG00374 family)